MEVRHKNLGQDSSEPAIHKSMVTMSLPEPEEVEELTISVEPELLSQVKRRAGQIGVEVDQLIAAWFRESLQRTTYLPRASR